MKPGNSTPKSKKRQVLGWVRLAGGVPVLDSACRVAIQPSGKTSGFKVSCDWGTLPAAIAAWSEI